MLIENQQMSGERNLRRHKEKTDIPGPMNGRINTLETSIAEKGICGFHEIPVNVEAIFAREIEERILKFVASNKSP